MSRFSELLSGQKLLPIIQADNPSNALNIAKAMADAGITLVEIVMRSEDALDGMQQIKQELPELVVGVGTVYSDQHLKSALNAGADFIVTPTVSDNLLSQLYFCEVPVLPGVANSAQVLQAYEYGYREMKFFPAALSGGTAMLTALGAVFKDIQFCPTGGINENNKNEYLSLENVFAVGGTWMVDSRSIAQQDWASIIHTCELAIGH